MTKIDFSTPNIPKTRNGLLKSTTIIHSQNVLINIGYFPMLWMKERFESEMYSINSKWNTSSSSLAQLPSKFVTNRSIHCELMTNKVGNKFFNDLKINIKL